MESNKVKRERIGDEDHNEKLAKKWVRNLQDIQRKVREERESVEEMVMEKKEGEKGDPRAQLPGVYLFFIYLI